MRTVLVMLLLLSTPMTAIAQGTVPLLEMIEQQEQLREDLAAGMDGLTPRQSRVLREAQEEFFAITAGKQALQELSIAEKVRLENALESINAQMVGTRDGLARQDNCVREAKTGSRNVVTRCGTREEADEARRGAREFLERPKICSGQGCG
ncbi:MAG: hypothetical protein M3Q42_11385 [Pseudomonadota bacterium]|nr:hypothetical protein [Pseudomonadota bacterium]